MADVWREDAAKLESYGATDSAVTCRRLADEVERRVCDWENQSVPLSVAAEESGYSTDHLRRLVREGKLAAVRGDGKKAHIRIRQADIPLRPGSRSRSIIGRNGGYSVDEDARNIAQLLGR
jgi:hypothetical protein